MTLPTCGVTPPYALPALRVPPPPPMRGRGRGRATVSQSVAVATAQANMLPAAQLFIVPCHVASSSGKVNSKIPSLSSRTLQGHSLRIVR